MDAVQQVSQLGPAGVLSRVELTGPSGAIEPDLLKSNTVRTTGPYHL